MTNDPCRFFDWQITQGFASVELTRYFDKARLYAVEPTFRETLHSLTKNLSDVALGSRVRRFGLGLFRPDAIAHGKVECALAYFARFGVRPVYCATVQVTPEMLREIWRYQLNAASGERLKLLDLVFTATPSILTLFDCGTDRLPVPCAALMGDSKGSANPALRAGWELRSHLNSPHRIEVYMHTADEPIDVVRDGGILLGPERFATAISVEESEDITDDVLRMSRHINEAYGPTARAVEIRNELLRIALTAAGLPPNGTVDRWGVVRKLGAACGMFSGPGETIICHSGTDPWWEQAGLLSERTAYLSARAGSIHDA